MTNNIMLVSFYNPKSLGLRYIEKALLQAGFDVTVVFFKKFNSANPNRTTDIELRLIGELIEQHKPLMVGFSVMASLYLETVYALNEYIRASFDVPIIWGGVYPTLFPEECLNYADYVLRGEGEAPTVELARIIKSRGSDFAAIKNLAFKKNGEAVVNEIRDLTSDLDMYGIPDIGGKNKYLIDNDTVVNIDPQVKALNYELSASRGCPFACTYCSAVNLNRLSRGKGRYVRFRSVDNVMDELHDAKKKIKNLKVIHFWDEIFCDENDWVERFSKRYKKEINLPFEIWGHPLKTSDELISSLKEAGLYKVVMGIQSGSPYIRKQIFARPEKQEEILNASRILSKFKVPQVIYDFMLRHPFETYETLMESFELCMELEPPFELQLHGLNFLPGTDIVQKAIDMNLVTPEDMHKFMHAPIEEQYNMHWKRENSDEKSNYLYKLIYLTQFKSTKKKCAKLALDTGSKANQAKIDKLMRKGQRLAKLRYLYRKGIIVLKGTFK